MGNETEDKILDMMSMINTSLHALHENTPKETPPHPLANVQVWIAILAPIVTFVIIWANKVSDDNVRFTKLESDNEQCKELRIEDKKFHNGIENRISGLDDEIHKVENGLADLTASNSNFSIGMIKRIRKLEQKGKK